ncbi:MAG TPA: glycosyltransferase family A protein [Candidatus Limnocylindrales bacterium]|nr:glycosyltransferase family A protein [Candidatus Limnocylindrales bacterium]
MNEITVAVPFAGAAHLLPKAVNSLLEQTYRPLRVVVVADGEDAPPLPDDPRLTVYRLPENRGAYFAQAVALAACESEWFTIHGADDWSDPDRLERLLAAGDDVDAVFGGSVFHRGDSTKRAHPRYADGGQSSGHVGLSAAGIFRTAAVQAFGFWSHPEFRVSWDSMMINLVIRHLRWRHLTGEFGYHRVVRDGSLTQSPTTGLRTPYRRAAQGRRAELWTRYADHPADIPVAPAIAAEVLDHADALSHQLRQVVAA